MAAAMEVAQLLAVAERASGQVGLFLPLASLALAHVKLSRLQHARCNRVVGWWQLYLGLNVYRGHRLCMARPADPFDKH